MGKTKKQIKNINKKNDKKDRLEKQRKEVKMQQNIKNRNIKKMSTVLDAKFIEFYVDYINTNYPNLLTYNNLRKFNLEDILQDIMYFLRSIL
jgi:hypothetical protein